MVSCPSSLTHEKNHWTILLQSRAVHGTHPLLDLTSCLRLFKKIDRCWLLINPVNLAAVNSLALVESGVKVNDLSSIPSMFFQKELHKEVRMGKRHHTPRDRTGTLRSNFY